MGRASDYIEKLRAGETVFDDVRLSVPATPGGFRPPPETTFPTTSEGIAPGQRYVIRQKGVVERGTGNCLSCHNRVLPDGTALIGAQLDIANRTVLFGNPASRLRSWRGSTGARQRVARFWRPLGYTAPGVREAGGR